MTTPSTTIFRRGDIVLVPFEFTDRPIRKRRPALVISSEAYHKARQDVIIAAITSRMRRPLLYGDHLIGQWQQGGLLKPSVMTAIVRTVKGTMISRRLGRLARTDMEAVDARLARALDLRIAHRQAGKGTSNA
ncbi:MAG: type II toxin-antitoxin system PemK/MazF family toxin [Acidimicrobiia bacterium]